MPDESGSKDDVSTINSNITKLISERNDPTKYPPSRVARIINRSIRDENYEKFPRIWGLKKADFIGTSDAIHQFPDVSITITRDDKKVTVNSLTLPSIRGQEIYSSLDELLESTEIESLEENKFYELLALMAVTAGTAHAFADGSGRTALGLVDVFLRQYQHKMFDISQLVERENRIANLMITGGIYMLPGEFNVDQNFEHTSPGSKTDINIPSTKHYSSPAQIAHFSSEYGRNIVKIINEYNLANEPNTYLQREIIKPLAEIFKSVAVEMS